MVKKRAMSILLTLCMVLCLVPASVFADGCGKYYGDAAATKEITKAGTIIEKLPDGEGEKIPQTGGSSNIMLWIALFVISGGVMSVTMIINKRKKRSMR